MCDSTAHYPTSEEIAKDLALCLKPFICEVVRNAVVSEMNKHSICNEELITTKEAASILGISERTFRRNNLDVMIPSVELSQGVKRYVKSTIIDVLLGKHKLDFDSEFSNIIHKQKNKK